MKTRSKEYRQQNSKNATSATRDSIGLNDTYHGGELAHSFNLGLCYNVVKLIGSLLHDVPPLPSRWTSGLVLSSI